MTEPANQQPTTRRVIKPKAGVDPDTAAYAGRPRLAQSSAPLVPRPHPAPKSDDEYPFANLPNQESPKPKTGSSQAPGTGTHTSRKDPVTARTVKHQKAEPPRNSILRCIFGSFDADRVWTTIRRVIILMAIVSALYILYLARPYFGIHI